MVLFCLYLVNPTCFFFSGFRRVAVPDPDWKVQWPQKSWGMATTPRPGHCLPLRDALLPRWKKNWFNGKPFPILLIPIGGFMEDLWSIYGRFMAFWDLVRNNPRDGMDGMDDAMGLAFHLSWILVFSIFRCIHWISQYPLNIRCTYSWSIQLRPCMLVASRSLCWQFSSIDKWWSCHNDSASNRSHHPGKVLSLVRKKNDREKTCVINILKKYDLHKWSRSR